VNKILHHVFLPVAVLILLHKKIFLTLLYEVLVLILHNINMY